MGGVTVAHQPVSNEICTEVYTDDYSTNLDINSIHQSVSEEHIHELLDSPWSEEMPVVEDLTGEVQDLMMRESLNSWLQPWTGDNINCLPNFDSEMYAQSIQLEDLFGQDQLNFAQGMVQNAFYEDISFAPNDSSPELSTATSSASSVSGSSAQISPVVQPIQDPLIEDVDEEISVDNLQVLDEVEFVEVAEEQIDLMEVKETISSKRRRNSSSSEESSDSSSSEDESDSENENVIPTTVANMNNRRQLNYSSSSDSESDSEPSFNRRSRAASPISNPYLYMHKRQIEETLLDRITNNLSPEKLPGILPILASEKASNQQEDEVEIDLSCLAREQLVQVLSYVDACILEQNGGPVVNVEHYITKKPTKKGPRTRPSLHVEEDTKKSRSRNRKPAKPRTKSRAELTENIDADSSSCESADDELVTKPTKSHAAHGPMSMASLSKKSKAKTVRSKPKKMNNKSKSRRKGGDDDAVATSISVIQDPDSIASSRPKRRAAVHKRRLLEDMLAPSDNEADDDSEDSVLVVYSDEKMDLGVVDNCTIMHQVDIPLEHIVIESKPVIAPVMEIEGSEDTDEEIDIMC